MRKSIKVICIAALLAALDIITVRLLSITIPPTERVSFQFLPDFLAGGLLGPVYAGLTCLAADLIGSTVFAMGVFSPYITVVAVARGVMYGLILYKRPPNMAYTLAAVILTGLVVDLVMMTAALSLTYGNEFVPLLIAKAPFKAAQTAVACIIMCAVWGRFGNSIKRAAGMERRR